MRIGIIGAGELGGSLAEWWTQAGHDVVVGSPQPGHGTPVVTATAAAAFGDVVLFAPDWATAHTVIDATAGSLAGKPVLDATDPVVWSDEGYRRAVPDARGAATRLIQDVGFAPFFAGGASNACLTEIGGPLRMREVDVADATATFAQAVGRAW